MLLFTVALMSASVAFGPALPNPSSDRSRSCPRTTSYLADKSGLYRGKPLSPRKLTELPPATTYMAVYRHIGLCEAPMTMVEYRTGARR
jgi:hypothetical protein